MTENGVLTTNFTYDDWGRATGKTQGIYEATYDWRYGDKLKDVMSDFPGEAATVSYIYDGLGKRRVKHVNGSDWTHYRWDRGWNMIAEYDHGASEWDIGNLANTFIPGLAEVPGTTPATGNYRYYETDHLGTVKGIRDQNQSVLAGYDYSPYGDPYYQAGLAMNKGFTGHTWEADTILYYTFYRYFVPARGTWQSRDPLGIGVGTNVYSYVVGNPIARKDRLGLRWSDSLDDYLDDRHPGMRDADKLIGCLKKALDEAIEHSGGVGNYRGHCVAGCELTKCNGTGPGFAWGINWLYEILGGDVLSWPGDAAADSNAAEIGGMLAGNGCKSCADKCRLVYDEE